LFFSEDILNNEINFNKLRLSFRILFYIISVNFGDMLQERIYSDYRLVIVIWMKGLLASALAYRMIELKVY
jgi:hypothetical protein